MGRIREQEGEAVLILIFEELELSHCIVSGLNRKVDDSEIN